MNEEKLEIWLVDHDIVFESMSKWMLNIMTVEAKADRHGQYSLLYKLRCEEEVQLAKQEVLSTFSRN